jgi:aminopeptidase YwaD
MHLIAQLEEEIAFLTGPLTTGRLSGTEGAFRAAQFLASELASAGYQFAQGDSFMQGLSVPVTYLTGVPQLKIGDDVFQHRRDYGEIPPMSTGGTFEGSLLVVRAGESLDVDDLKGKIVLISGRTPRFNPGTTAQLAVETGVVALLMEAGEPKSFYKNPFFGKGLLPVLRVRSSAARRIEKMQGVNVKLHLPLERGRLPCNNVLGFLPGTGQDFTLVLTAHYDHVGDDPGGARFPGAMDNAAGTATLLAAARQLAGNPLHFNLIIAFLTGEEAGLVGAKHLIAHQPLPISAVINLDVIGREPKLNAMRLGHAERGDWLAELTASVMERHGISPVWKTSGSDGSAFLKRGLTTVGLMEQPKGPTKTGMHVPTDTMENLHFENIAQGVELLVDLVNTLAHQRTGETIRTKGDKIMSTNDPKEPKKVILVQQAEEGTKNASDCCGGGGDSVDDCCGSGGSGNSSDDCCGGDGGGSDCCG